MGKNKRLYVLDTNVLMHDPTSMFRFEEHDVFLPMIVLEELDAGGIDEESSSHVEVRSGKRPVVIRRDLAPLGRQVPGVVEAGFAERRLSRHREGGIHAELVRVAGLT